MNVLQHTLVCVNQSCIAKRECHDSHYDVLSSCALVAFTRWGCPTSDATTPNCNRRWGFAHIHWLLICDGASQTSNVCTGITVTCVDMFRHGHWFEGASSKLPRECWPPKKCLCVSVVCASQYQMTMQYERGWGHCVATSIQTQCPSMVNNVIAVLCSQHENAFPGCSVGNLLVGDLLNCQLVSTTG